MNNCNFIELLRSHIKTPFITAFAYGSGVFKQGQVHGAVANVNHKNNKMIDYLVVVRDEELSTWHENNFLHNPNDYPVLGKLAAIRSNLFKNSIYYVPNVQISNGRAIKYGVVGWDVLIRDLFTWDYLFLAGRLQKPTKRSSIIKNNACMDDYDLLNLKDTIDCALEYNLDSALRTALLLDPIPDFIAIVSKIVSLSYTNDPRLWFAESPQKIQNIVKGQIKELEEMYLEKFEGFKTQFSGIFSDPIVRLELLNNLPLALKNELLNQLNSSRNDSLWQIALNNKDHSVLASALGRIVKRSAWKQMFLGTISTSPAQIFLYSLAKVKKRFE